MTYRISNNSDVEGTVTIGGVLRVVNPHSSFYAASLPTSQTRNIVVKTLPSNPSAKVAPVATSVKTTIVNKHVESGKEDK